ncbi:MULTISPECIES: sensor histidine kinase [unclassified Clostridium]|uniref:ATP-binding protein n=1 Tax=unclassified Clostridium TaxID=2614128 RepID=UPI0013F0DEBD|nr:MULTISPECIES: sensor histidine kinase [unclassified Clostridium]NFG61118.1 sensor histidine kinase [Clostridium botulinum]NFQ08864.1 sensor histidine kinase [Clostridium botulinum]
MFKKRLKSMSVMNKILMSYFILIFIILTFTVSYNAFKDINDLNTEIDENISHYAQFLSDDKQIKKLALSNMPDEHINDYLDTLTTLIPKIDFIVITNKDDIRLYHPDHTLIGKPFLGRDEYPILEGSNNYITETIGSHSKQRRAFSSIKDYSNNIIGFVMVSSYSASISDIRSKIIFHSLFLFIISAIIGLILSFVISKSIKKTLLGYEPVTFTEMYLHKKEVLDSLDEGIIAVNHTGKCILYNNAAINMLRIQENNTSIDELIDKFISSNLINNTVMSNYEYNKEININDTTILTSRIPIYNKQNLIGSVSIFRDKTEVKKLAEELTGVNHIIKALRANIHEQMNKLHIILGLLQIGDTDKAIDYISCITEDHKKNYSFIISQIKNRTLAALIIGKVNRAKELNIDFKLQSTSFLDSHNKFVSTNNLVTIIGNLLENSFDALNNKYSIREVTLYIHSDDKCLTIIVDDTGTGISQDDIKHIFKRGFSRKGNDRGIGLNLVYNIVESCNGTIDVESELDVGTSITIMINKKRNYMKG